jgi:DNA integrity scanning protein DisA with diadenylate cyclase activity
LKAIYSELEKLIIRYNQNNVKEAIKILNFKLVKLSKMKAGQGIETEDLEKIQMENVKKCLLEQKEALERRVEEMRQELYRKKNLHKVGLEKIKGSKEAELASLVAQIRENKSKIEEGALVIMEYEEHINNFMSDCLPKYTNINCKTCGQAAFKLEHLENISDKEAAFILEQHQKREAQQVEYPTSSINNDIQDD